MNATAGSGSSVFVSHSSVDRAATERFCERLKAEGVLAGFVDIDPVTGLVGGQKWENVLYTQIRRSDAVLFLRSPASIASPWCFAELALARSLGKPVVPIDIEPTEPAGRQPRSDVATPLGALLADTQSIDLTREPDRGFERLWIAMRRHGLDPRQGFGWDAARPPYPGLVPFEAPDAAVFFGRDREIQWLMEAFQPAASGPGRFIALVGPSGSGKSSLLRAGLLPRLGRLGERWRTLPILVPGRQPLRRLARGLVSARREQGQEADVTAVLARLTGSPTALGELIEELRDDAAGTSAATLLVVDQFEEIATLSEPAQANRLLELVGDAVRNAEAVWAVATLRAEFAAALLSRPGVGRLVDDARLVSPLERADLFSVIEGPATRAGLRFAPGLAGHLVEETQGADALPLLAFTLRRLFDQAGPNGMITWDSYRNVGGVLGALRLQADAAVRRLAGTDLDLVVETLTQLATVSDTGEVARRRVARASLDPAQNAVVQAFVDERLLVSGTDNDEPVVEVAHEALLRQWPPLAERIARRGDDLRLRGQLERRAQEWRSAGRSEADLLGGDRLAAALRWADANPQELDRLAVVRAYLKAGEELRDRVATERAETESRRRLADTLELVQRLRAQADEALALLPLDPPLALSTAVQAVRANLDELGGEPLGFVQAALFATVRAARLRRILTAHEMPVTSLAADPGGRWLASGGQDHTLRIWPLTSLTDPDAEIAPDVVVGVGAAVTCLAVSGSGRLIAAGDALGRVTFWRRDGSPAYRAATVSDDQVLDVAFGPGHDVWVGCADGRVLRCEPGGSRRIRELTRRESFVAAVAVSESGAWFCGAGNGELERHRPEDDWKAWPIGSHEDFVTCVRFSPDGTLLASAAGDGSVRVVDRDARHFGGFSAAPATRDRELITSLVFSPDGTALVTGDEAGQVRLRRLDGRPVQDPLPTGGRQVSSVVVSQDSRWVAAGCGQDLLVWDWLGRPPAPASRRADGAGGEEAAEDELPRGIWDEHGDQLGPGWRAHDFIAGLAFTPDGEGIVSVGGDRCLRLWDVDGSHRTTVRAAHDGGITSVACTRGADATAGSGGLIATGGRDNAVRLWHLDGRSAGPPLTGHTSDVMGVAFSPSGGLIASAGRDGTVRLWHTARTGLPASHPPVDEVEPIVTGADEVQAVAFSPDGELVACGCDNGTVQLWTPHGDLVARIAAHTGVVWDVQFSADGQVLASCGDDQTARLWTRRGEPHGPPVRGHSSAVRACGFHPSGQPLVTAGADGTLRLWGTGGPLTRAMTGHESAVFALAIDQTGELAASGGSDGSLRVWRLGNWSSWLREADDRLGSLLRRRTPQP